MPNHTGPRQANSNDQDSDDDEAPGRVVRLGGEGTRIGIPQEPPVSVCAPSLRILLVGQISMTKCCKTIAEKYSSVYRFALLENEPKSTCLRIFIAHLACAPCLRTFRAHVPCAPCFRQNQQRQPKQEITDIFKSLMITTRVARFLENK